MFCDSSDGLVCYMEDDDAIHVCNPITREHKMLQEPPRLIKGICGLMNLNENLIIVAAIGQPWAEELNNGFSIWLLKGKGWQEISRVTDTYFYFRDQLFGYSCSGADDLIYIHADYDRRLVVFDMNSKQWNDCQKCPMKDVNNGFCLQPRLISP
ncbi:unnamed protein product [Rhodiola kirilowii]